MINDKLLEVFKELYGISDIPNYQRAHMLLEAILKEEPHNIEANIVLADMYENGFFVEKSCEKAYDLYRKLLKFDNAKAYYKVANLVEKKCINDVDDYLGEGENGKESLTSEDIAYRYYVKSARLGSSEALSKLGLIYEQGYLDTKIDIKSAYEMYEKSLKINKDNKLALNGMGNIYFNGSLFDCDYGKAAAFYMQAARFQYPDALNNLGICYEYGKGVKQNYEKALECYHRAGVMNHSDGLANEGILTIKLTASSKSSPNLIKSFKLLNQSLILNNNNKQASYYLGLLYETGLDFLNLGTKLRQPYIAFLHYKRSAELGCLKAKTKVGLAVFNGIENVFHHDEEEGLRILREAAEEGEAEAIECLDTLRIREKKMDD